MPLTRSIELPIAIDYKLYDPQIAIDTTKKNIKSIIDGLIKDCDVSGYYKVQALVKPLTDLQDFFKRNVYETEIKKDS